jgi:antitoxin (DNA-binding transcriptional repressor) of toxin-antitoxin stability system
MPERASTLEVRQRIGDLLSRVALRRDEFIIERKGKPLAALIPVERPEQMRWFARRRALEILERQAGNPFSDEEAMDLAVEAQRSAREHPRQRDAQPPAWRMTRGRI